MLQKWTDILAGDLKSGKNLTLHKMYRNFNKVCKDFASIEKTGEKKQIIRIVGEFYVKYGFHTLPPLRVLKEHSRDYVSQNLKIGDGWLMGAEVIGCAENRIRKILCMAPFGCMPNVCAGRGLYPYLQRCFKDACLVTVETDSSGSKMNNFNRVQMLIDWK